MTAGSSGAPALVLGSSSRYRAELLGRLGVPFTQESPRVDERAFDADLSHIGPRGLALKLARAKADALRKPGGDRRLLCADQVGVLEGSDGTLRLLQKPGGLVRCVDQLMELAGRTHQLVNGIVLLDEATGVSHEMVDVQELTMRCFGRDEAEAYAREFEPFDCAGGYRIEDRGILLFDRLQSDDFTGIIGLPLLGTARLLRLAGLLDD